MTNPMIWFLFFMAMMGESIWRYGQSKKEAHDRWMSAIRSRDRQRIEANHLTKQCHDHWILLALASATVAGMILIGHTIGLLS